MLTASTESKRMRTKLNSRKFGQFVFNVNLVNKPRPVTVSRFSSPRHPTEELLSTERPFPIKKCITRKMKHLRGEFWLKVKSKDGKSHRLQWHSYGDNVVN